jgi:hypothetical protein
MKVLEIEVTGSNGVIHISQPDIYSETGYAEVIITTGQLELFRSMLEEAAQDAIAKEE